MVTELLVSTVYQSRVIREMISDPSSLLWLRGHFAHQHLINPFLLVQQIATLVLSYITLIIPPAMYFDVYFIWNLELAAVLIIVFNIGQVELTWTQHLLSQVGSMSHPSNLRFPWQRANWIFFYILILWEDVGSYGVLLHLFWKIRIIFFWKFVAFYSVKKKIWPLINNHLNSFLMMKTPWFWFTSTHLMRKIPSLGRTSWVLLYIQWSPPTESCQPQTTRHEPTEHLVAPCLAPSPKAT